MKALALFRALALSLLAPLCAGCGSLNLFSPAEEARLGEEAYAAVVAEYPEVTTGPDYQMVQRVGHRIAAASGVDFDWEFKLLQSDEVNAFCLPGGKVAVYTGILPVTRDEDGLAAVLGHEVAHATERHGGKRMTQYAILEVALTAAGAGLSMADMSDEARQGVLTAFGLGSQLGILAYSRDHETEADEVGIRYTIRAGYDPYAAVRLWERMAELGGGGQLEWLSTHPNPLDRARNLEQKIPQILAAERSSGTVRR